MTSADAHVCTQRPVPFAHSDMYKRYEVEITSVYARSAFSNTQSARWRNGIGRLGKGEASFAF